jgi:DNA-binding NtrC family response regulator
VGERGHQVLPAGTAEAAVRLGLQHAPDLAVLDLDLRNPQINGLGVFAVLKARLPQMIGVVLTGRATVQYAFDSGRIGIARFVEKPIRPEALGQLVDAALQAGTVSLADGTAGGTTAAQPCRPDGAQWPSTK